MATVELKVSLPDDLAREAEEAGLLDPQAIETMVRDTMRRRRVERLFQTIEKLRTISPPVTETEIAAEIDAARAQRRALDAARS
jgi:hypothetical protein